MKKIIYYFLILLLAVWLGLIMSRHVGYVLISYGDVTIASSLWFAALALIVIFSLLYLLLRCCSKITLLSSSVGEWYRRRRRKRAQGQTIAAIYDLLEGNFAKAEKRFMHFAPHSDVSLINYLGAAIVAQQQGALDRQERYMLLAQKIGANRDITVAMVRVRLAMENGNFEEATIILQDLKSQRPRNKFILSLLKDLYVKGERWDELKELLPALRKYEIMASNDDLDALEHRLYEKLLWAAKLGGSIDDFWKAIPRYLQKKSSMVAIYTQHLLEHSRVDEAEAMLKIVLRKELDGALLRIYANIDSRDPIKHLTRAEKWLRTNPQHPDLMLILGKICWRQKLWGKAKDYLERSVKFAKNREAHLALADFFAERNDLPRAVDCYHRAFLCSD